jgi:hypothetical protein
MKKSICIQSILFFIFYFLSIACLSQDKIAVKLGYLSCYSTHETWINESNFENVEGRDSVLFYDKNKFCKLKKLLKKGVLNTATKIDVRVKLELNTINSLPEIVYFDNNGLYCYKNKIYAPNYELLKYIKILAPNIDCWIQ